MSKFLGSARHNKDEYLRKQMRIVLMTKDLPINQDEISQKLISKYSIWNIMQRFGEVIDYLADH